MTPVDRVLEVATALGRSPRRTIVPILPGRTPIINDFLDVPSAARASLGTPVGLGWFPIAPSTIRLGFRQLSALLLSKQRLDLLLGLVLALQELG